ncbi:hypothetical protein K493DRAFT_310035 [Basidiobolus meristosporus CBS 931.73]|uniref:Ctf8-domain-containing protein n=1 Tax=Basidiobolus meristosporus CBS 931.73 TaxID=1314790 RepID=A0A1Y1ZC51_9FUNG|nr:hypothetical protein K493DRAFT_310035 [Basidiobolus meristosporus CBS 931.73]|eukprot:ORY07819.1 hypothetical protein K493DRAFT_310035 [Basidiobolus meristosporus CBS 931.73]
MVQILLPATSVTSTQDHSREMILFELQGSLETSLEDLKSVKMGDITYNSHGDPILYIGNHKIEGSITKLRKPLALIKKLDKEKLSDISIADTDHLEYRMVTLIKQKYVFKARPDPVIAEDYKGISVLK